MQIAIMNVVNLGASLLWKPTTDPNNLDYSSVGLTIYAVCSPPSITMSKGPYPWNGQADAHLESQCPAWTAAASA